MLKTIIIDDEKGARASLKKELELNCPEVELIGEADSVVDGVKLIRTCRELELLFLDIQMMDGSGFDLLEKVEHQNFKTIFTTAFSDYALRAIKFSPQDYLLKPIDGDELREAVDKVLATNQQAVNFQMRHLLTQYRNSLAKPERVALATSDGIHLFPVSSIIRCASNGNYTTVFFEQNKKLLLSKTLKEMEETFSRFGFERIHKSHLVNMEHIRSYVNRDGGEVIMSDGKLLPVAQRKKAHLLHILGNIGA